VTAVPTLGLILAGGRARRASGGDKVRIRVGGTAILDRVVSRLGPQCRQLILGANGEPARFADTGLTVVSDSVPDYAGPLAGILAGLDWTASHAPVIEWLVSVPGDCPFLPADLVTRLHRARLDAGTTLACARSGGRPHPAAALWPVSLREQLRRALTIEGVRKVEFWAARYGAAAANWPVVPADPFFNVNTAEDVATANRLAAQYPDF
jgi:molybdopterin-guanine dinucleotide biosynthesis protein A